MIEIQTVKLSWVENSQSRLKHNDSSQQPGLNWERKAKAWKWWILSRAFSSQLWNTLRAWSCYPSVLSLLNNLALSGCLVPLFPAPTLAESDMLSFSPACWMVFSIYSQPTFHGNFSNEYFQLRWADGTEHVSTGINTVKNWNLLLAWRREQESFFFLTVSM